MKRITSLLCAIILLSSATAFGFSDSDRETIYEMNHLDKALCNAKTIEEIDDLLESADPDLKIKYLQNTIDKLCSVYNDTQVLKDNNQVRLYCLTHEYIEDISIDENANDESGVFKRKTTIELKNGASLLVDEIDEPEYKAMKAAKSSSDNLTKEFGDRRYTSKFSFSYNNMYPGTYQFRLGYNLSSKKKIKGRYLTAFPGSFGKGKYKTEVSTYDKSWVHKASNSTYVDAYVTYNVKCYINDSWKTSGMVKIKNKVNVNKWNNDSAALTQSSSLSWE